MLHLIIAVLLSMGFNIDNGYHFSMNSNNARIIKNSSEYNSYGGNSEFAKFVNTDERLTDDVIIIDDDTPDDVIIIDDDTPKY